ncbi:hypothetical protein FE840_014665 [Peteryoungia desertarenae]|uniref:Uncharacterized protein n=1 Tax=Peteryoungia desertarenae TaxID=1813451 RepID=A0ABX6QR55_9HYPH|nr:hypothetical protein [Peteryoungia desertarenae]QLF70680.1 hypothetical protein FE840_014665 [Peteryoungia desertarenae]
MKEEVTTGKEARRHHNHRHSDSRRHNPATRRIKRSNEAKGDRPKPDKREKRQHWVEEIKSETPIGGKKAKHRPAEDIVAKRQDVGDKPLVKRPRTIFFHDIVEGKEGEFAYASTPLIIEMDESGCDMRIGIVVRLSHLRIDIPTSPEPCKFPHDPSEEPGRIVTFVTADQEYRPATHGRL